MVVVVVVAVDGCFFFWSTFLAPLHYTTNNTKNYILPHRHDCFYRYCYMGTHPKCIQRVRVKVSAYIYQIETSLECTLSMASV